MNALKNNTYVEEQNIVHKPDYERAEMNLLRDALRRTYTKKILVATPVV